MKKAINIIWDVDEKEDLKTLPTEMLIPDKLEEDEIPDYLSDQTGFCHKGYVLEEEDQLKVLISIKKKWVDKILSGEKTIEIRKTKPKNGQFPLTVYIYETKAGGGSGKVVAEFICDKIIDVDCDSTAPFDKETEKYIEKESCVDRKTFWKYTNGFCAYGWHISDLKVYDKPKELFELFSIKRAPQSWCYVK